MNTPPPMPPRSSRGEYFRIRFLEAELEDIEQRRAMRVLAR